MVCFTFVRFSHNCCLRSNYFSFYQIFLQTLSPCIFHLMKPLVTKLGCLNLLTIKELKPKLDMTESVNIGICGVHI